MGLGWASTRPSRTPLAANPPNIKCQDQSDCLRFRLSVERLGFRLSVESLLPASVVVKYVDRDRRGGAAAGKSMLVDVSGTHLRVSPDDSSLRKDEELFQQSAAFPLLSPSVEDDTTNEQQDLAATSATIDGKEKPTWQAAAGNAENDDIQQLLPMSRPIKISDDDFKKIRSFCRPEPSVELLAVYPYFPFYGQIIIFDENSGQYVYHQEKGEKCNLDSQGNLVLTGPFETISGFGIATMKIEIPDLRAPGCRDTGTVDFRDDPYAADQHEERIITTENGRELVVTYVEMSEGLGVHVRVSLRLFGDDKFQTIGVHGEITGHNWLFGDDCVLLFLCGEEEKVQLTPSAGSNGSVILEQMQRRLVTVPINTLPLLTIKVRLNVTSPSNEGGTITFEGDVAFPLDKDQKMRTICTKHGEVKVNISY